MPKQEQPKIIPPEDPNAVRERDLQDMPDLRVLAARVAMTGGRGTNKTQSRDSGWDD